MWWDWFRTSRVYVGQGLVLVQPAGKPMQAIQADQVNLADALVLAAGRLRRHSRIHVQLGAERCMAIPVQYPRGLRGFGERLQVARSVCASSLGLAPEQTHCEIDALQPHVAAAMTMADWQATQDWAKASGLRLASLRPLWSVVSESLRLDAGKALVVVEPGATTVLGWRLPSRAWAGFSLAAPSAGNGGPAWTGMLDSMDFDPGDAQLVHLFATGSAGVSSRLPLWPGYLEVAP